MAWFAGRSSQHRIDYHHAEFGESFVAGAPLAEQRLAQVEVRARELAFQGLQVFTHVGIVSGSDEQLEGGSTQGAGGELPEQRSPVLAVERLGGTQPRLADLRGIQAACRRADELAPGAEIVQQDPARDAGLLLHLQRGGCRVAALDQDRNRGVKQLPFRRLTTLALTDPDRWPCGRTPCSQGELLKLCSKLPHYRK